MADNLRWRSLCLGVKVSINSGAALLLFLAAFFLLTFWAGRTDRAAGIYPVAVGALTGAFGGFLVKRHTDKKIPGNGELK